MERTVRKPRNMAMTLASVLLCLVLGSSYLVAGMLAKYTSGDSEDDSSRVAKFSFFVSDVGDSHIVDLRGIEKPGDELTYSFSVNSNSEVSVSYDITLMVNGSMPLTATVNTATPLSVSVPGNDTGAEATRESAGTFTTNPGGGNDYTLTVNWPADQNDLEFASGGSAAEVRLVVTGMQID